MRTAPITLPFLLLCAAGCSKEFAGNPSNAQLLDSGGDDSGDTGDSDDTGTPGDTFGVSGVVVGADRLPLAGAEVSVGSSTVTTSTDGTFTVSAKAGQTLTVTAGGRYPVSRAVTGPASHVRVGLLPRRVATPVDVAVGGTLSAAGGSLTVPAGALGESGLYAVTFDPLDTAVGLHALPAGLAGESDQVATVYGAVVIGLAAPTGPVTTTTALSVSLPLQGDAPGGSAALLVESGGVWHDTGANATLALDGTHYVASFTVTESGTYAVGRLDASGCVSGTAIDADGAPAPGALVRSYVRAASDGVASYLGEVVAGDDGSFCAPGSAGGISLLVDYTDGNGAVWSGGTNVSAAGSADTCEDCNNLGNVQLSLSGCATGNLYASDGGAMPESPFVWEEGDVVTSTTDGTASSLTFYARAGVTFKLAGPGGLSKAFSVTSGTTPDTANCTRLGNLQSATQCVMVDVSGSDGVVEGAWVESDGGGSSATDSEGNVCIATDDGTTTFTADYTVGAQAVAAEASVLVEPSNGSCQAGVCFSGPSLVLPEPGCVDGIIRGEGGVLASGVTVWSSSWDSVTSGSDGSFSLTTAGSGTGGVWADGWGVMPFTDGPASSGCTTVSLYADAGAPPPILIAEGKDIWRVNSDFSRTDVKLGAVVEVYDVVADTTADLTIGLLRTYAWSGALDGADWDNFDYPSSLWSAVQIAPDGGSVALQGYGASNSTVWVYEIDGSARLKLSSSAGTDGDGLAWSRDSAWVASTRKDDAIEVTPANGSRAPVTIASPPCAHPIWWDADTVALACDGDMMLYEMDGSSSVSWHSTGADERIWAVTSLSRVIYTRDEELHIADLDGGNDVTLLAGSPGTTFARVRATADGSWLAAIVTDPATGTDVLAVADQAPYTATWLTSTPSEIETSLDWPD